MNDHPIILELGCGKGEYTVGLAQKYPENNYIGIDIKGARIWRGCKTSNEKQLRNVAFIRTKTELIEDLFQAGEIREIWLSFPDPQPKKSKARKRMTSPLFLNRYRNILTPDHLIHLKTDNDKLFHYTMDIIREEKHTLIYATEDIYKHDPPEELTSIQTHYEKLFLQEGLRIKYLKFRLNQGKC